mmetsp:Transcript_44822/g.37737  ORF Transcript_44822/g.37737 Transcript_44822/m.37737 type:complete len:113 (-) Transcript_44822:324-662(-)
MTNDNDFTEIIEHITKPLNLFVPLDLFYYNYISNETFNTSYSESLFKICTILTLQEFWGMYSHMQPLSKYKCGYILIQKDWVSNWESIGDFSGDIITLKCKADLMQNITKEL